MSLKTTAAARALPLPPDHFDARAASPTELRRYGLPQRPDPEKHPTLAALWEKIFSRKLTHIVPSFRPMQELLPGVVRKGGLKQNLVTVTNGTWSGAVVHATGSQVFTWVQGQWNVPDVAPPTSGQGTWYSFTWVGIDGGEITQIGTVQSVTTDSSGRVTKSCYAVYEWYPNSWQGITNFPVAFGDTVYGLVCMDSPTEAYFNLLNLTTNIHVGFTVTAPSGSSSVGNQIEWVLERPEINGVNPPLPRFGDVFFDSAMGGQGLTFLADAGTDTAINIDQNGTIAATTTVETPTLIKVAYTGG